VIDQHDEDRAPDQDAGDPKINVKVVGWLIGCAVALLGAVGFILSYNRVSLAARPTFGHMSPLVSIGIDIAIFVFAMLGILLAFLDMPARWLRIIPAGLTGVTIWLNVSGVGDGFGIVAHATMPALWVVSVAVAEHVVRYRLRLKTNDQLDLIRTSRWFLAPITTMILWRRMVLWEIKSYRVALDRERARLLTVAALHDAYGWLWRVRAPRRLRVLYRLGELDHELIAVVGLTTQVDVTGDDSDTPPAEEPADRSTDREDVASQPVDRPTDRGDESATDRPTDRGARSTGRKRIAGRPTDRPAVDRPRDPEELYRLALTAREAGRLPNRPSIDAIRTELSCARDRARDIQRRMLAEDPVAQPVVRVVK
jgi:hypothetical protein